ncbi:MAG: entericidin B [Methylophilaceae bacterium]|jgi:entericidin B
MSRLLLAVLFVFSLSACNTIDGMGKDIEKAGKAVQKSTR